MVITGQSKISAKSAMFGLIQGCLFLFLFSFNKLNIMYFHEKQLEIQRKLPQ